jgi:hypothetical protein
VARGILYDLSELPPFAEVSYDENERVQKRISNDAADSGRGERCTSRMQT